LCRRVAEISHLAARNVLLPVCRPTPEGNETTFVFDGLSRVASETNELGKSRFYRYDSIGNVIGLTDRNGRDREFDYNNLDLMVEERWLDGQQQTVHSIEFGDDPLGQMVEGCDSFANYAFTIDPLGRVTEIDNQGSPGKPRVVTQQQFDLLPTFPHGNAVTTFDYRPVTLD
jgi:YD repeat-containing protein